MKKFYSIKFNTNNLTDDARRMLDIAMSQGHWIHRPPDADGNIEFDVIDYDSLGSDDTFSIRVRDNLAWRQRAERFGVPGIEYGSIRKDADGSPLYASVNHPIPSGEYISSIERAYEGSLDHKERRWSLRDASDQLFGRVKGEKITGADAMNAIAAEFWQWCKKGDFSPVIPRGRDGGRYTIGDEPTASHTITCTDTVWEWLKAEGNGNASAGLRKVYGEHHA